MLVHVGRDLERPEGRAKVTGRAIYTADLAVPGAWVGGAVRSNVARGRLAGFDFDPAFDFTSVAIVGPADIPGENVVALIANDQPLLCRESIEHFGEPLLLVAAPDRATLLAALAHIHPRIEPREPVLDMEHSTRVLKELHIEKGDAAWLSRPRRDGTRLFEGTYRTDSQEQLYIEPQACIAWPKDEGGTHLVQGSLQCPHYVQKSLARALGVAPDKARVVQLETGGGFGGKEDYPSIVACHAALLAEKVRRPVKVIYERHEDLAVTPKRHPSRVTHKTLVDRDGELLAMDIDVLLDGGAYTTLSPVVLSRGAIHATGPYRCENVVIRGRVVATNHVPYGAFRGFGAPQTCFAIERQMDRIARALSIHPLELRRRNMLRIGDTTATGQVLRESVGAGDVLEDVAKRSGFDAHDWCAAQGRDGGARKRRGLGLSFFFHGAGFTGSGEEMLRGEVEIELADGGVVELRTGSTEIGQGTNAMFLAIAAEALGAAPDDVRLASPDTGRVPNSGPTVASRTCMVVGGCLARACRDLSARIDARVHDTNGRRASFRERARLYLATGGDPRVRVTYEPPRGITWDDEHYRGDAYPVYGWGADVAEVEVDVDTCEVDVLRLYASVDVGRAIQPMLVEGQIEGGSLQAVGFAHLEVVSTKDGRFEQDRLATCVIPTSLDAPKFDVKLFEHPYSGGPFGAKGVGELPMDGGAPAVASAIEDAIGVHVDHVPATPERLFLITARSPAKDDEERA
jgi:CO/xanthine dehydrogenase Mo-binding subunit